MTSNISTAITIDSSVNRLISARIGFRQIGQPILFTFGLIGCSLNILIFLRPSLCTNSCAICFHTSTWANLFCLTFSLFVGMISFFINYNLLLYNTLSCKMRYYILTNCQLISRACVVFACLDRFFLCSPNVHHRLFCRSKIAIRNLFIIIGFCSCLTVYVLVVYDAFPQTRQCTTNSSAGRIIDTAVLFVFNFGIPAVSMTILSCAILWRLKQNAKRLDQQKINVRKRDVQLATMLLGQVVLYILTALPFVSNFVYITLTQYDLPSSKSAYRSSAESLAITATGAFGIYVFNAMTFYVYTLTAPSFRRQLVSSVIPRRWINGFQRADP
ncbi:unnamed protein product [Adineta ricciae]|uniref:G-protein coupled receptors family 1 profile domain-containing protein n=1 Tax=Adineta ricciae TaxID=249248 RepID=A0A816AQ31_ADIRI|nr:unnamed protein product [Adineta ricciae]CAF1600483.1 unnamed protein product [Adineta ricciae]